MSALLLRLFPTDEFHVAGFHAEVERCLPDSGRLLDLGCGSNAELASYRSPTREVWGTDFQAHSSLQHADWFRLLPADGIIPFPANHFDVVTSMMVLEHVERPRKFLREVARVIRPGGHFIGHTVSGSHYVTWLRRVIGLLPHSFNQLLVQRLYGRPCEDTFPAHYRLNRGSQIYRACRGLGLSPVHLKRYADPGYFRFSSLLQDLAIRTDWVLERLASGWGRLYLTVVLRRDDQ